MSLAMADTPERYLKRRDLVELLGISYRTIQRWDDEGCPRHNWGLRDPRYLPSEVIAWAERREQESKMGGPGRDGGTDGQPQPKE